VGDAELAQLTRAIAQRVGRYLKRQGLLQQYAGKLPDWE